jgi:hypothetical protein
MNEPKQKASTSFGIEDEKSFSQGRADEGGEEHIYTPAD